MGYLPRSITVGQGGTSKGKLIHCKGLIFDFSRGYFDREHCVSVFHVVCLREQNRVTGLASSRPGVGLKPEAS